MYWLLIRLVGLIVCDKRCNNACTHCWSVCCMGIMYKLPNSDDCMILFPMFIIGFGFLHHVSTLRISRSQKIQNTIDSPAAHGGRPLLMGGYALRNIWNIYGEVHLALCYHAMLRPGSFPKFGEKVPDRSIVQEHRARCEVYLPMYTAYISVSKPTPWATPFNCCQWAVVSGRISEAVSDTWGPHIHHVGYMRTVQVETRP